MILFSSRTNSDQSISFSFRFDLWMRLSNRLEDNWNFKLLSRTKFDRTERWFLVYWTVYVVCAHAVLWARCVCARAVSCFELNSKSWTSNVDLLDRPTTNWFRASKIKTPAEHKQINVISSIQHRWISLSLSRSPANALAHRPRMAWTEWKVTKINTKSTSFPLKYISCWVQRQTPDTGDCGLCIRRFAFLVDSDTTTI